MNQHLDETICVGHIIGAQGVLGWLKVFSNTSPRANILNYGPLLASIDGAFQAMDIVQGREQGKQVLIKLDGVDDRDQAMKMSGQKLYIRSTQLPVLNDDEFYWSDLIGMSVESLQADALGIIDAMIETGANDVMVLKGDRERLIPFVLEDIVKEVDLTRKRVLVDWQPDY